MWDQEAWDGAFYDATYDREQPDADLVLETKPSTGWVVHYDRKNAMLGRSTFAPDEGNEIAQLAEAAGGCTIRFVL